MATTLFAKLNTANNGGAAVWLRKSFRLVAGLGFLMLGLALFAPALGGSRFVFGTDTVTHDYIMHMYGWQQSIGERGELPLWCPQLFGGLPFIASAALCPFYPSQWLYAVLPFNTGFTLQYVLAVALGGLGFAWWMRVLGHGRWLSIWGGCVFAVSGHFLTLAHAGHLQKVIAIAWAPVALGATVLVARHAQVVRRNTALARAAAILVVAWAMQLLATHPQIFYATAGTCMAYLAGSALVSVQWRKLSPGAEGTTLGELWASIGPGVRGLAVAALALVGALGLSAVQVLPSGEMKSVSNRAAGVSFEEAVQTSYPPGEVLEYVVPSVFGDSVAGSAVPYFGHWGERIVSDFLGFPLIILALIGVVAGRGKYRFFLLLVGVLALLVGFGKSTPMYGLLYKLAPGFNGFRSPGTFMFLADLALVALAVQGLEAVISAARRASAAGWNSAFQSSFRKPQPAAEEHANIMDEAAAAVPSPPPGVWIASPWVLGSAGLVLLLCVVAATIAVQENWSFNLRIATDDEKRHYHLYRNIMIGALELGLALVLLVGSRWAPRLGPLLLAVAAFALPLVHNYKYLRFEPLAPYMDYLKNQPVLRELRAKGLEPIRLLEQNTLKNDAILSDVGTASGYHPVVLESFVWLAGTKGLESEAFTQALGVNYARTFNSRPPGGAQWAQFTRGRKAGRPEYVWQRQPMAPYLQPGEVRGVDGGTRAERSALAIAAPDASDSSADAGRESDGSSVGPAAWIGAVVDRAKLAQARVLEGPQQIRGWLMDYEPHRVRFRVESRPVRNDVRVLLPVAESAAPGWQAQFADGQEVPVVTVNGAQRALAVPAGEGVVTMRYTPFSFRLGLFITLCTTALLLAAAGGTAFRRAQRVKKRVEQLKRNRERVDNNDMDAGEEPGAAKEPGGRKGTWWAHQDSNLGPAGYEPAALTN